MTVKECRERISATEFRQWQIIYANEPFGDRRGDIQAAIIAQVLANINRRSGARLFTVSDFMPKFWQAERTDTSANDAIVLRHFAAACNAVYKAKN